MQAGTRRLREHQPVDWSACEGGGGRKISQLPRVPSCRENAAARISQLPQEWARGWWGQGPGGRALFHRVGLQFAVEFGAILPLAGGRGVLKSLDKH